MQTPVLTKKQQKKALSSSKKKKEAIRSVLASPYTRYWPLVSAEDASRLDDVLHRNLPALKTVRPNIPWKELKDIPREQRKEFREKLTCRLDAGSVRGQLAVGINETAKLLENDGASCVLITSEISPQFLVKHLVDLSVMRNVPVLIVPSLKETLNVKTGINGSVLALSRNITDEKLVLVRGKVEEIYCNYPVPEHNPNLIKRDVDTESVEVPNAETEMADVSGDGNVNVSCFLYRKSKTERVFVPKRSTTKCVNEVRSQIASVLCNFVPLRDDTEPKGSVNYKALIVKRLKGDKNRNQRKSEAIKKKKKR